MVSKKGVWDGGGRLLWFQKGAWDGGGRPLVLQKGERGGAGFCLRMAWEFLGWLDKGDYAVMIRSG